MTLSAALPLSLYVHIPWCVRKCPYCDFNSHEQSDPPWQEYVDALLLDLEKDSVLSGDRSVNSVFFGGGTPSLMPGGMFTRLMDGIRQRIDISADPEITLEANPGSVDAENFEAYLTAGVNRLSIGAQSFRNRQLELLGRVHRVDSIMKTLLIAKSLGFENINIDLMHSLPDDSEDGCLIDLRHAIKLSVQHISWYELTIEDNTAFQRKPPQRPLHEEIIELHSHGVELLEAQDYYSYEVSAYAQDNYLCRHNLNYWQFGDYIGIGAGAHGKLTDAAGIRRTEKRPSPNSYMKGVKNDDHSIAKGRLSESEIVSDFAINAFRLSHGFEQSLFESRTGLEISVIEKQLQQAEQRKLISVQHGMIKPTVMGRRFLNDLQVLFF